MQKIIIFISTQSLRCHDADLLFNSCSVTTAGGVPPLSLSRIKIIRIISVTTAGVTEIMLFNYKRDVTAQGLRRETDRARIALLDMDTKIYYNNST